MMIFTKTKWKHTHTKKVHYNISWVYLNIPNLDMFPHLPDSLWWDFFHCRSNEQTVHEVHRSVAFNKSGCTYMYTDCAQLNAFHNWMRFLSANRAEVCYVRFKVRKNIYVYLIWNLVLTCCWVHLDLIWRRWRKDQQIIKLVNCLKAAVKSHHWFCAIESVDLISCPTDVLSTDLLEADFWPCWFWWCYDVSGHLHILVFMIFNCLWCTIN